MFGYIVIHEPELRVRELALYRSYYCGLCEELHARYGRAGQLTLRYDTTFLALLLTSLYEPSEEVVRESNCLVHPLRRHTARRNLYTAYAADVTVLLAWYACRDDWQDERSLRGLAMSGLLHGGFKRAARQYPEKARVVADCLQRLQEVEKGSVSAAGSDFPESTAGAETGSPVFAGAAGSVFSNAKDATATGTSAALDAAGACFGELLAELFAFRQDAWEAPLRRMGFYLGKFIYLLDAYDDLEKDALSGSFNPLLAVRSRMQEEMQQSPPGSRPLPDSGFDDYVRSLLTLLMASCCRAFEALPIVENVAILRNILYAGVWTKFSRIYETRTGTGLQAETESIP